jgi:hypothetical protein
VLDAMLPGRDGENGEGVENWGRRAAKAATAVGDEAKGEGGRWAGNQDLNGLGRPAGSLGH